MYTSQYNITHEVHCINCYYYRKCWCLFIHMIKVADVVLFSSSLPNFHGLRHDKIHVMKTKVLQFLSTFSISKKLYWVHVHVAGIARTTEQQVLPVTSPYRELYARHYTEMLLECLPSDPTCSYVVPEKKISYLLNGCNFSILLFTCN